MNKSKANEINEVIILNFHGAFKFTKGDNYLFNSDLITSEGIYIWSIKDEKNGLNFVHYIGETLSFGKRQREHLIHMTGLNYRIIDPESARQGVEKILWNGLWRDRTNNAVLNLLDNYGEISKKVLDYIGLINVYFAPTSFESSLRKHVEGCLGWNFRIKYPDFQTFYPNDNHVGSKDYRNGKKLIVNLPEEIAGIDREQII